MLGYAEGSPGHRCERRGVREAGTSDEFAHDGDEGQPRLAALAEAPVKCGWNLCTVQSTQSTDTGHGYWPTPWLATESLRRDFSDPLGCSESPSSKVPGHKRELRRDGSGDTGTLMPRTII